MPKFIIKQELWKENCTWLVQSNKFFSQAFRWLTFIHNASLHACWLREKNLDLGPEDSTFIYDIVEVGRLPCFKREDGEIQYAFYIIRLTVCLQLSNLENRHGLCYECSSNSKIQVCPS